MREVRVAVAQFEARDGDKPYNLDVICSLARKARESGAELISFHECSIPGYTFLENLTREELIALAEPVPEGPSVTRLIALSRSLGIAIGAGLVEIEGDALYNCYAVVTGDGLVAKHRKLHAFVSEFLTCGDRYTVFDLLGAKF